MPKGSCLCGQVKYEFTGESLKKVICHCLECRKISGSAFSINLMLPKPALQLTGEVRDYDFRQENGDEFTSSFCTTCGSTICKRTSRPDFRDVVVVEGGSLDDPAVFQDLSRPEAEFFTKHRALWLTEVQGSAQVPEAPFRKSEAGEV